MRGPIHIGRRGFELVIHDHQYELLVTKVRCNDLLDIDRGDFICRRAVDLSNLAMACWASIYKADGRLTTRSREVSKPRDSV